MTTPRAPDAACWHHPQHSPLTAGIVTADVVGVWLGGSEPSYGVSRYLRRITEFLGALPALWHSVTERTTNGEFLFIHWTGRAIGIDGPVEFHGVDRLRVRDGLVQEVRVSYDLPPVTAVNGTPERLIA
jgi:hypothetical protein